MTAIWRANMLSLKSESCAKTLRSAICVSLHQAVEVRSGRKWSLVFFEKGCPIRDTGKKSQPNGKLRHYRIGDKLASSTRTWKKGTYSVGVFPWPRQAVVDSSDSDRWRCTILMVGRSSRTTLGRHCFMSAVGVGII